jgi:hypothetical protein
VQRLSCEEQAMTKRTMVLLMVVEERDDAPTYDATGEGWEVEESSAVVPALPKRALAKCGADLMALARRAGGQ